MASEKANKVKDQSLVENSTTVKAKSTFREYAEAIIMATLGRSQALGDCEGDGVALLRERTG